MAPRARIFVYGTLMRGDCRHSALQGQPFVAKARTQPRYRLLDCGSYPGLIEAADGRAISGEVFEVDQACLVRLDEVEGVAEGLYARRPVLLQPPFDADGVEAYFFLHSTQGLPDCGGKWSGKSRTMVWSGDSPQFPEGTH